MVDFSLIPSQQSHGLCVVVQPGTPNDRRASAMALARTLNIPLIDGDETNSGHDLTLIETGQRLELHVFAGDATIARGRPIVCDLTMIDTHSGPGRSLNQPLLKAVGIARRNAYRPYVLDVTAGLGEDAWVLASVGCRVDAYERNPVTHALLADGLVRACQVDGAIADRIRIHLDDGIKVLQTMLQSVDVNRPDVIYLDPMFPLGRKTAERKAMRVLRMLCGDDPDADQLLATALQVATRRVVVKRPLRSAALPGSEPTIQHKGKSLRFDVYVTR